MKPFVFSGTIFFFLRLVEGSLTTRAPNVGWKTIWTTQVLFTIIILLEKRFIEDKRMIYVRGGSVQPTWTMRLLL